MDLHFLQHFLDNLVVSKQEQEFVESLLDVILDVLDLAELFEEFRVFREKFRVEGIIAFSGPFVGLEVV